jgi:hypothetical protein
MKRSLYFIVPTVFAFNMANLQALEIDEKLTLRFLKVSSTKKTVLINRGGEDGLVVGDHAKFFITAGVVARGVSEKVSPSRSVWSLYRIVDPAEIVEDKVLNLKIASPVKITEDPSKSLKEEVIPGGEETMNVAGNNENKEGSSNQEIVVSDEDKDELKGMGLDEEEAPVKPAPSVKTKGKKKSTPKEMLEEKAPAASYNNSKTWEAWGTMYFNALTGTYESDDETTSTQSTSASSESVDFSVGVEKYLMNFDGFLKELSVGAFVHKRSVESGDTLKSKTAWLEYGAALNYHFYNSSASINKLVGFASLSAGVGSGTIESKTEVNGVGDETATEGSSSFFSLGVGAKYVLNNGFGIRAIIDYYSSSETYEYETYNVTRALAGPRVNFGLSYRF